MNAKSLVVSKNVAQSLVLSLPVSLSPLIRTLVAAITVPRAGLIEECTLNRTVISNYSQVVIGLGFSIIRRAALDRSHTGTVGTDCRVIGPNRP